MLRILISMMLMLITFVSSAQKTFKYCNTKHFQGYSIVFTKEYVANFSLKRFNGQFTPTKEEIDSAENIFMNKYSLDINKDYFRYTNNPVKYYRYFKRQYIGLIGLNGNKLILIQMLNVPKPRQKNLKYYYENWENEYVLGSGDFYYKNTVPFIVNLTTIGIRIY